MKLVLKFKTDCEKEHLLPKFRIPIAHSTAEYTGINPKLRCKSTAHTPLVKNPQVSARRWNGVRERAKEPLVGVKPFDEAR